MSDLANTFDAIARNALLQSTIIFLIGMLIARFAVRRPARVHTVLALAFLAAIVAPLASEAVRRVGWGVLPPEPVSRAKQATAVASSAPKQSHESPGSNSFRSMNQPGATETVPTMVDPLPPDVASLDLASRPSDARTLSPAVPAAPVISAPASAITMSAVLVTMVALAWAIASALLLVRLLDGVIAGRRLLRSAARCDGPAVHAALAAARDRLGMNQVRVDVFQSVAVRCPMIWCWAPRPQLLLPVDAARDWSAATWAPVLCHELAHWKRRDHWAALIAEAVCCLMPWQVLAWWAKRRLENASEQACDDWTVAVGHSAVDYAETLLGLVAQADPPLALAALRRRSGLAGRIQHILTQTMPHPRLGRVWAVAVLLFAVISIGVAAVCQRGVARADAPPLAEAANIAKKTEKSEATKPSDKPQSNDKAQKPATISPGKPAAAMAGTSAPSTGGVSVAPVGSTDLSDEPETFRVVGRVITTDGKPIADAEVYWDVFERPLSNRGHWPGPTTIGHARTAADGAFAMEAKFSRKRLNFQSLVIRAAGYGLRAYQGKEFMSTPIQAMEIRLEPSLPIEGSIFTPDGVPVAGARVTLAGMYQGSDDKENWNGSHLSLMPAEFKSDEARIYWPAEVVTDAQGKFRMEDVTPRRATADLRIAAPDYPATLVSVRHPDSVLYNSQVVHRDSPFMLVLEAPYIVNGRFLDETTGEPIANVRMESQPHSNNGINANNNNTIKAVSDADGRYTLRVGSADLYFVKVFPPLGYPSVQNSISARQINQLAGADRTLDYVLKLRKGIVLKGRVVDAESGEGVARAQVYYKPEAGRKLGVNDDFFPVTTADDGTFEATAVDGKGFLLVDVQSNGFYRLAVRDPRVRRFHEGLYPHGMIEIDVPSDSQPEPLVIPLKRGAPNENLGREFLELFALGVGNYTETDVREAARALTGWQYVSERRPPLKYMPVLHDAGEKSILGQTGAWADEDLARIASAHPAAARRIAWRLWRTFVSDVDQPSPELLEGLAAPMRAGGDVDVARGLEVLLRSRLFHSEVFAGRRVLSPVEWTVSVVRAGQTFPPHPNLIELIAAADRMGQRLFVLPNVAGWPGGLEWLSDPALVARQNFAAWLTSGESNVPAEHWQQLAAKHGAVGADAELDFWSALFWGRLPQADERSRLSAELNKDGPNARAALVAALLGAADAQLA